MVSYRGRLGRRRNTGRVTTSDRQAGHRSRKTRGAVSGSVGRAGSRPPHSGDMTGSAEVLPNLEGDIPLPAIAGMRHRVSPSAEGSNREGVPADKTGQPAGSKILE